MGKLLQTHHLGSTLNYLIKSVSPSPSCCLTQPATSEEILSSLSHNMNYLIDIMLHTKVLKGFATYKRSVIFEGFTSTLQGFPENFPPSGVFRVSGRSPYDCSSHPDSSTTTVAARPELVRQSRNTFSQEGVCLLLRRANLPRCLLPPTFNAHLAFLSPPLSPHLSFCFSGLRNIVVPIKTCLQHWQHLTGS